MREANSVLFEDFGELVHVVTRADLIADGLLVDVSKVARLCGFRIPVALTAAAWVDCVAWTKDDSLAQCHQDEGGRLWDVLWLAQRAAVAAKDASVITFELLRVVRDGESLMPSPAALTMMVGPGDNGEPVITVKLTDEAD